MCIRDSTHTGQQRTKVEDRDRKMWSSWNSHSSESWVAQTISQPMCTCMGALERLSILLQSTCSNTHNRQAIPRVCDKKRTTRYNLEKLKDIPVLFWSLWPNKLQYTVSWRGFTYTHTRYTVYKALWNTDCMFSSNVCGVWIVHTPNNKLCLMDDLLA